MKQTNTIVSIIGLGLVMLPVVACDVDEYEEPQASVDDLDDLDDEDLDDSERGEFEQAADPRTDPDGEPSDLVNPADPSAVVYGFPVNTCEWPATVSMMGNCTGSLVHPEMVIYAAHCGTSYPEVWFGETNAGRTRTVATTGCQALPGGGIPGAGDDFAFCRLATPVTDVPIVPPLMGTETSILQPGQAVTLAGFGFDEFGNIGTKRWVDTTINSITAANEAFIGGSPGGGSPDTCQGDSGGPVYVQLADGTWRVFGITSYGGACGTGGYYSMMHIGMEWFEQQSGLDITPCHTASGNFHFGAPDCIGENPTTRGSGSWTTGCGTGSSSNTCCEGQAFGTTGCSDTSIQSCVCAADSYCCDTSWDSLCAAEVESLGCGSCPAARPKSCCESSQGPGCSDPTIEAGVCAADPFCCNVRWDGICVSEVETLGFGTCESTCCEPQTFPTPGCADATIEACVCAADPYCCNNSWDSICAGEVTSLGCSICS